MKSLIAGIALCLAAAAAPAFAANTVYPSKDPGVGIWQNAVSTVAIPSNANDLLRQREKLNNLRFRVIITERGDDTTADNPAFGIMRNHLWDEWVRGGGFDDQRTVVLIYMPDHTGAKKGFLSVRVGHPLNVLGIKPDHLNAIDGPIKPAFNRYMPNQAWEGLLKVVDNINYEYNLKRIVAFDANGPIVAAAPAYSPAPAAAPAYQAPSTNSDDSGLGLWWVVIIGGVVVVAFVLIRAVSGGRRNNHDTLGTPITSATPNRPAPRPSSPAPAPRTPSRPPARPSSTVSRPPFRSGGSTTIISTPSCSAVTPSAPSSPSCSKCGSASCSSGSGSSCGSSS